MKDWKVLFYNRKGPSFWELTKQVLSSTKSGYDQLAEKFDYTPYRTPVEILDGLDHQLGLIGPFANALDVCCGTGAVTKILLKHTSQILVGLDISQNMMDIAQKKMSQHPSKCKVNFVQGDVLNIPFRDKFDLVTNLGGLGHIRKKDTMKFLAEVNKALSVGGKFILVTTYHPSIMSFTFWRAYIFNALMHIRNAVIKPPFIMYYLTFILPEIEYLLTDSGFQVDIKEGVFPKPFHTFKIVIATKI